MELPQRSFGTEGRKPTHDFLSLYTQSAMPQDPRPPSSQAGGYLKTHDFLQPLERVWKTMGKEESNGEISSAEQKPAPPSPTHPQPQPQPQPSSVEHILPGGIGTYSISHISYCNNQRYPKAEGGAAVFAAAQASSTDKNDQENSNCSSYTGSGFTLFEESAFKKGKTGKENIAGEKSNILRDTEVFLAATEAAAKSGQWTTTSERPSLSSSNNHRNSFSSLSSSHPPMQKSQSFLQMIKSAKGSSTQDDDLEDVEEFVVKKETQSPIHTGGLRVKVDEKSTDQKANTPRSKHSATEQRRRSKINDRFHMLRELIPHGDQKRDKASFLLEVIEYIQFLQEKVNKYEGPYQGWNHEPAKLVPWRNNTRPAEGFVDQSRGVNSNPGPALLFSTKLDEKNIIPPSIPGNAQNPVESDISSAANFKAMDHLSGVTNRTPPFPMTLQPNFFNSSSSFPPRLASNAENMATQPPSSTTDGTVAGDKLREQDLTIEAGRISISSAYSQGYSRPYLLPTTSQKWWLLTTLTQALKSSGVDLSQASVSVQIELGKRGNGRTLAPTPIAPIAKGAENSIVTHQGTTTRSRVSGGGESDQLVKKLKTGKS